MKYLLEDIPSNDNELKPSDPNTVYNLKANEIVSVSSIKPDTLNLLLKIDGALGRYLAVMKERGIL